MNSIVTSRGMVVLLSWLRRWLRLPNISRVNSYVAVDSRLAGQDVPFGLVLPGERVLHVHRDIPRKKFDSARCAGPRATGAVNEHSRFVGNVENRRILGNLRDRVRCLKDHFARNLPGSRAPRGGIAC